MSQPAQPLPHHWELWLFPTMNPKDAGERLAIGNREEVVRRIPKLPSKQLPFYEVRPVFLTPAQQAAVWSQNPPVSFERPTRDYD